MFHFSQARIAWVNTALFAHSPKGGVLTEHLPTWVAILLTVGGAEMSVRHGYGGVRRVWQVSYSQLATVYVVLTYINRGGWR